MDPPISFKFQVSSKHTTKYKERPICGSQTLTTQYGTPADCYQKAFDATVTAKLRKASKLLRFKLMDIQNVTNDTL